MTIATRKMTADEFLELPIQDSHGRREELIHGELIVSPRPFSLHANVLLKLAALLMDHVQKHDLGIVLPEIDIVFEDDDVRSPDIAYYKKDRAHLVKTRRISAMPNLAVEILSTTRPSYDRIDKFKHYQKHLIPFYWIVDPEEQTIEAWTLENGKYTDAGRAAKDQVASFPPFPDLQIPLKSLWWPT
jgi:Uma2 family endonuclease